MVPNPLNKSREINDDGLSRALILPHQPSHARKKSERPGKLPIHIPKTQWVVLADGGGAAPPIE